MLSEPNTNSAVLVLGEQQRIKAHYLEKNKLNE